MNKREWTSREVTFLIDSYTKNYSYISIANSLGRSTASIDKKINQLRAIGSIDSERRIGGRGNSKQLDVKFETFNFPTYNEAFRIDVKDFIAFSDVHLPFYHKGLFEKLVPIAKKFGVKTAFIIGDFLNLDTFSSFDTARKGRMELENELIEAEKFLNVLLNVFDEIYISAGNHETRMLKSSGGTIEMDRFFRLLHREVGNRIQVSNYKYAYVNDSWILGHPDEYNRQGGDDPAKKAMKYRRNVISGHNHMFGITTSLDGQYLGIDHGCACDQYKIEYYMKSFNNHPVWQNGFTMVKNNKPYLFNLKFTDWGWWLK